ncbi:MAG: CRISPR-associated endoribonuclease Cas6 [Candidatus Marinimicrobia bacterium]|nr:CRISPR-associated endoribonuclease Cas6 [Candidatus Neomarinimicrobiota bacterium]
MRLKIKARAVQAGFIPLNYSSVLQAVVYELIDKSSPAYAQFLHDEGFHSAQNILRSYKLFTFSKLILMPYRFNGKGFEGVHTIEWIFTTAVQTNYEHLVYGLFADQNFRMRFGRFQINFTVVSVESMPEPEFDQQMKFVCLSPLTVSSRRDRPDGQSELHFLDYFNPAEKDRFIHNIYQNLVRKYETLHQKPYEGSTDLSIVFDPDYIVKKQGKISKLIHFKNGIKIKAFEAPFTITADPELIKIGYQCGFGEKNSAGFGCVESVG